jgi:hypothetical protein
VCSKWLEARRHEVGPDPSDAVLTELAERMMHALKLQRVKEMRVIAPVFDSEAAAAARKLREREQRLLLQRKGLGASMLLWRADADGGEPSGSGESESAAPVAGSSSSTAHSLLAGSLAGAPGSSGSSCGASGGAFGGGMDGVDVAQTAHSFLAMFHAAPRRRGGADASASESSEDEDDGACAGGSRGQLPALGSGAGGAGGADAAAAPSLECPDTCSSTALPYRLPTAFKRKLKKRRKPELTMHLTDEAHYHSTRAAAEAWARASTQLKVADLDCRRADGSRDEAQYRRRERQIRLVPVTPESLRCHRYDGICAGETYVLWDRRCLRHGLAGELARSAALGVGAAVRGVAQRVLAPALQHGHIAGLQAAACRELMAAGLDGRAVLAGTASPETIHSVLAAVEQTAAAGGGSSTAAVAAESAAPLQLVDSTVLRRAIDGTGLHSSLSHGAPKRSRSRVAAEEAADASVAPAAHADAADTASSFFTVPSSALSSSSSSLSASASSSSSASSSGPAAPVSALGRLVALAQTPLPQIAPADGTALLAQLMPGQTDTLRMPLYSHAFAFARVADRREAMGLAREAVARLGAPMQQLTLA